MKSEHAIINIPINWSNTLTTINEPGQKEQIILNIIYIYYNINSCKYDLLKRVKRCMIASSTE